jgi:hypothetical protein
MDIQERVIYEYFYHGFKRHISKNNGYWYQKLNINNNWKEWIKINFDESRITLYEDSLHLKCKHTDGVLLIKLKPINH